MTGTGSNADEVAARHERMVMQLDRGVATGVNRAMMEIHVKAVANLSGGGDPYTYPVPTRSGHLRRSENYHQPNIATAILFNTADYAYAVHSGNVHEIGYFGPGGRQRPARPFLDDAVEDTDYAGIILADVRAALGLDGVPA